MRFITCKEHIDARNSSTLQVRFIFDNSRVRPSIVPPPLASLQSPCVGRFDTFSSSSIVSIFANETSIESAVDEFVPTAAFESRRKVATRLFLAC